MIQELEQKIQNAEEYKTEAGVRDLLAQVMKPLYSWMYPENGENRLIVPKDSADTVDRMLAREEFNDWTIRQMPFQVSVALTRVQRNSLYQYYRQMEAQGADVYALEEYPYRHDREWKEFSLQLGLKYQAGAEMPAEYTGGTKLLIIGLKENPTDSWTTGLLGRVSPMDIATGGDEAGYILKLEWDYKQLTKTVVQKSGKEVGGTYRTIVTVTLYDLASGDVYDLGKYSKDPLPGGVNSNVGKKTGQFSSGDVGDALEENIAPVLSRFIHVFE